MTDPRKPHPSAPGEVTRSRLKGQYPDYLDDSDGLQRFREAVLRNSGHGMAAVNYNSLGRLTDTIERLRRERDEARLATSAPGAGHAGGSGAVEPVAWVSPGQLANLPVDPADEGGAQYLPIRHTSAGNFTMPLYAAPSVETTAGEVGREEVARIVYGWWPRHEISEDDPATASVVPWENAGKWHQEQAFERADAILSALSRRVGGEG